ncbi:MAG: hypothetical protein KF784_14455 [Fimbriimonadaceae bacterium]|nr:hypothetical protein [Fimbriimonadaceae bacterium]
MLENFYYHPRMLGYDFGGQHPLQPERLRRTLLLLETLGVTPVLDPGLATRQDALRVHSESYLDIVSKLSSGERLPSEVVSAAGFGTADNPIFEDMYTASLAYLGGTVRAAENVRDGSVLAFNIAGGLHHAQRDHASGFCILNDPAIAVSILLEKYSRVVYIDIDVHHGDGVQVLFWDDPRVLTCSIHQDPRTLYPGTGAVDEVGPTWTSVNVPLMPRTTGDVWLWAFVQGILPAVEAFNPEAVVLQMGTDAHFLDPLAHIQATAQDWVSAVRRVKALGLPTVAVGGGGYNLGTVPRMWAAACLTLGGIEFEDRIPEQLAEEWGMPTFFDSIAPGPAGQGLAHAEQVVGWISERQLPELRKA